MICKIPNNFELYLANFGTNPLFTPLFISMVKSSYEDTDFANPIEAFDSIIKPWLNTNDPEKIGLLIQNLLTKVVHICIFETSLSANHKNLFKPESKETEEFDRIFS